MVRAALAAHDISTVYRLLQAAGYSQKQIAAWTGQSQPEVSAILHGRRVISYAVLARIADGLGIPRGYLGLSWCGCPSAGPRWPMWWRGRISRPRQSRWPLSGRGGSVSRRSALLQAALAYVRAGWPIVPGAMPHCDRTGSRAGQTLAVTGVAVQTLAWPSPPCSSPASPVPFADPDAPHRPPAEPECGLLVAEGGVYAEVVRQGGE